jgi:pimeloyl-ACP methyl ester carboxylesterase
MRRRAGSEGFVSFRGMRTWYRVAGDLARPARGKLPLLLLHGGPGIPSDPFEPLEALAGGGRAVVRYDQLGCGRSDRPRDPSLWTMATFVDELRTVRRELGLERVHLLGWSWGGMLALEYMLSRPGGIASLVLASAPASAPLWIRETRRLRDGLPDHVRLAMHRFESGYRPRLRRRRRRPKRGVPTARAQMIARLARPAFGVLASDPAVRLAALASAMPPLRRAAYELVMIEYTRRHLMRRHPRDVPSCFFRSFAGMNREVYETMWGPSEFLGTGRLRHWDVSDRLEEITVPVLITSGRYDEATPVQMARLRDGLPDATWVLFEDSAHAALAEESDRYLAVLEHFLTEVEQDGRSRGERRNLGSPGDDHDLQQADLPVLRRGLELG